MLESIDSRILNAMANMPRRSMILRYVVAVLASLAAAGIRFMIEPTVGRHTPYLPFVLAVIVVACLGGVGPTVLTTVTSGLVSSYFFLYPRLSFAITQPADIGGLVDFVVIATIINLLITQLRRSLMAQAEVNRKLSEQGLQSSLDDKVILLREIHHRVKNNLAIITSLLSMQANAVESAETVAKLEDCRQRVMSMAMIHEQLYNHADMSCVDLAKYVSDLAAQLYSCYSLRPTITYRVDLTPTTVTIEQAIPCGLILNELITNSLKYAYPGGKGEVLIRLISDGTQVAMTVSDQEVGLPNDLKVKASKSLGMTLVEGLTEQLNGQLEIGPPPGASFTVRFNKGGEGFAAYAATAQAARTPPTFPGRTVNSHR